MTRTDVEIDVRGRWDALALSERLVPYRSHLVQHGRERWVVHASAPGCHGERLDEALSSIDECLAERGIAGATLRVDGRLYRAGGGVLEPSPPTREART